MKCIRCNNEFSDPGLKANICGSCADELRDEETAFEAQEEAAYQAQAEAEEKSKAESEQEAFEKWKVESNNG